MPLSRVSRGEVAWAPRASETDFRHAGPASLGPYRMNAAFTRLEWHERGIDAIEKPAGPVPRGHGRTQETLRHHQHHRHRPQRARPFTIGIRVRTACWPSRGCERCWCDGSLLFVPACPSTAASVPRRRDLAWRKWPPRRIRYPQGAYMLRAGRILHAKRSQISANAFACNTRCRSDVREDRAGRSRPGRSASRRPPRFVTVSPVAVNEVPPTGGADETGGAGVATAERPAARIATVTGGRCVYAARQPDETIVP
jgi:hypothetical protein